MAGRGRCVLMPLEVLYASIASPSSAARASTSSAGILQRALDPHSALSVKRSTESAHRLGDAQTPGLWRAQWPLSTANRCISTSALGTAAATIAPDTQASADTDLQSSGTSGIAALSPGMQELLGVLSQPIPLSPRRSQSLNHLAVQVNDSLFIDPAKMLESTIRALYVIKEVLRTNGYVCVVNNNPAFAPLMRYAARCCLNSNVWWHWEPYTPGLLLTAPQDMLSRTAQPSRELLAQRGLTMTNIHCPHPDPTDLPLPRLHTLDKYRLQAAKKSTDTGKRPRQLLREIAQDEDSGVRFLLPGAGNQARDAPTLIVVLDLSHGDKLIEEAYQAGIVTVSVVNAHTPLDRITYPILAAEANPNFSHFFLNWLLKVVNLPTPPMPESGAAGEQTEDSANV